MKFLKTKWFIIVLVVAAAIAVTAFTLRSEKKTQYFTAPVTRGDLRAVVEATGTINAVTTVQVGSQVSGTIQSLFVDFNSRVKKGQVVARIDPSLFEGALMQAKADLENAKANVAASRANLEKSKASAIQAKQDYQRTAGLTKEGVMSQQQLDAAKATSDAADAQVNANQAALLQAEAQVKQRAAALKVAQTNLDHTIITSPIDGTVVNRSIDVGQTVAASLQAPTLFTIAQDLTKMQVYAKTDESDVGQIHPGQKVSFKVDAFPKDTFNGVVSQVRMNSTVVQNVVTYDTIINFDNPELKLFPGMTAYVTIPFAEAGDVLKVPNGALRFKPDLKPEELQATLKKYGMEQGAQHGQGSQAADTGSQNAQQQPATGTPQSGAGSGNGNGQNVARRQAGEGGDQPGGGTDQKVTRGAKPDSATVWKLAADGKNLVPVRVKLGITDRTNTEVLQVVKGDLKDGDNLIIGTAGRSSASGASRPGMSSAPGGAGGQRR